jgi:hypothetical protein
MNKRATAPVLLINFVGAALYLWVASHFWADAQLDDGTNHGGANPILWGFTALPLLGLFAIGNLVLLITAVVLRLWRGTWFLDAQYISVPITWIVAAWIDFSNH